MTADARTTLAHPDLATRPLEGLVRAARYVDPTIYQVITPNAALRNGPRADAEQINQLLFGEILDGVETTDGFVWGQARRDGYVGWVDASTLSLCVNTPTHRVKVLRTIAFSAPAIKSAVWGLLSLNALVTVIDSQDAMVRIADAGWAPASHLAPVGLEFAEPATTASAFLGAPYLWGGRDSVGVDCSGLIQQALHAAGVGCPRDADQQAALGTESDPMNPQRGDLVFWKGHVGMMVDVAHLLHANAHHMAVAVELLSDAVARIDAKGFGRPTAFRRL